LIRTYLGIARTDSLQKASVLKTLAVGVLALNIGLAGNHIENQASGQTSFMLASKVGEGLSYANRTRYASPPAVVAENDTEDTVIDASNKEVVAKVAAPAAPVIIEDVFREVVLSKGQTFAEMLSAAGVSSEQASSAMNSLATVYSLSNLRAGQGVVLSFSVADDEETLKSVVFQPDDTKEITISLQDKGDFEAKLKNIPIVREFVAAKAEIRTSLFEAGARAGVPRSVMAALVRIYGHTVDFQREIKPGDSFEILYDQPKYANGKPAGEGAIMYAALNIKGAVKQVYRVTFADKSIEYFDANGKSVRKSILRNPVDSARLTSNFGMRMHPILGYSKMHKGVDFGAPTGTPVFAAGDGVIEQMNFWGSYGNYVRIRHANGVKTAYAHMSRFNKKLKVGSNVKQGDVIAYVGNTGRSTGPHLHFEVMVDGRQVNPLNVKMAEGKALQGKQLAQFKAGQNKIYKEYTSLIEKAVPVENIRLSQNNQAARAVVQQ